MAYVSALAGENLLVEIETTPGGGTYGTPLLINKNRSIKLSANANATMIPNQSQSLPAKTVRVVESIDWEVSGSGILNIGDDKTYADMLILGTARSVRVSDVSTGGLVITGNAVITAFELTGEGIGTKVGATITIMGADLPVSTAHT